MKLKELSERINSVRKNLRALKPTENNFEKIELEDWKLEKLFSFETNLSLYENLQTCVIKNQTP